MGTPVLFGHTEEPLSVYVARMEHMPQDQEDEIGGKVPVVVNSISLVSRSLVVERHSQTSVTQ